MITEHSGESAAVYGRYRDNTHAPQFVRISLPAALIPSGLRPAPLLCKGSSDREYPVFAVVRIKTQSVPRRPIVNCQLSII